jgi:hypothetical protein
MRGAFRHWHRLHFRITDSVISGTTFQTESTRPYVVCDVLRVTDGINVSMFWPIYHKRVYNIDICIPIIDNVCGVASAINLEHTYL